jgi:hypothetical protein
VLYRQLLGGSYEKLAPALRRLHDGPSARARGSVEVRRDRSWLASLVGFPKAGENIPLDLSVEAAADRETWTRRFGGDVLRSVQLAGDGLMVERMGLLRMRFRVFADGADLRLESQGARVGPLPLPVRVTAVERGRGDAVWEFEVHVSPLGSYRGVMELAP